MPRNLQETTEPRFDPAVLAILRCPIDGTPLRLIPALTGDGEEALLATQDDGHAYPVRDGIAYLTPAHRRARCPAAGDGTAPVDRRKRDVQAFYDRVGWQETAEGGFEDQDRFEDMRPLSAGYLRRCRERLHRHLPPHGEFLLDCASGPVQFDEYLGYSAGFARRVCVDLSEVALRAARRRLGAHGVYVLGDATRLPFASGSMDAVVSLNTLFHVPAEQQEAALREFLRVAAPRAPVLVAYSWGDAAPLTRWLIGAARRAHALLRRGGGRAGPVEDVSAEEPRLYFHAHGLDWLRGLGLDARLRLASWKSLGTGVLRTYVRGPVSAALLLPLASAAERMAPALMGRIGQQPLLVLRRA